MSSYDSVRGQSNFAIAEAQSSILRSVFGWMTAGLVITGLVAFTVLGSPELAQSFLSPGKLVFCMIAEIGLVMWLSFRLNKMSATAATLSFLTYSALNGITLAPIAFVYTGESITSAFFVAACLFAGMAFYGAVTKRDLSSLGSFAIMGLFGILLAGVVNLFLHSGAMNFVINTAGILIFTGLTAWDVQKIRGITMSMSNSSGVGIDDSDVHRRIAIMGALALYLDLINLFISLLRLMGDRD